MTPDPTLTDEELAEMEARANAAAPGPWEAGPEDNPVVEDADGKILIYNEGGHTGADARFIAAARTDVPRLIAALRASREEVERLRSLELRA